MPNSASRAQLFGWLWGFAGFKAIERTYTSGAGWDNTAITAGMIARRVAAGVVTGIFEAKNTFTASADPASDTTNWRRCGLVAVGGTSDFWWNVEPGTKYLVCGMYEVGTGWKLAEPHCFPRNDLGTICRCDYGMRRMKKSGGFSVAVTNDEYWEDYWGALAVDVDWRFGRYCRLRYLPGDLVIRKAGSAITFWRCTALVDYWDGADGTGDPAGDAAHWVQWAGERSVWLDTSAGATVAGDPWFQELPPRRYGVWRETTEVKLGSTSLGVRERELVRDALSGWIEVTDGWVQEWTLPAPEAESGEDAGGTFYPASWPGAWTWVGVDFHYHRQKIANLRLVRGVYPDSTMTVQYVRNDYSLDAAKFTKAPSGSALTNPPWQAQAWPGPPNFDVSQASVSASASLVRVESGQDWVEWEWQLTVPWYHEFDVACFFATYDPSDPFAVYKDTAFAKFGKKRAAASGTVAPDPITWFESGSYMMDGVNTVHTGTLRIIQRVEVEGLVGWNDLWWALVQKMPDLPGWGFWRVGRVDRHSEVQWSTFSWDWDEASTGWVMVMRGNDDAGVGVGGWVDGRLAEYRMEMSRLAFLCYDVPHWRGEHVLGDSAAVQQINEVMTHLYFPDGTMLRVRVSDVQFT